MFPQLPDSSSFLVPPHVETSAHCAWFGASGAMTALFCPQYGIVLDAGSSHTNLYVYEWPAEKENNTGVVQQVEVCKVEGKRRKGSCGKGMGSRRDNAIKGWGRRNLEEEANCENSVTSAS